MPNQTVADRFFVSRSNLHRITSGRKYSGGTTTSRKVRSLEELEEHGEPMVKIAKVKGRGKVKVKVTKMMTPHLIPLPFLDEKPAQGTRGAQKRKDDDEKPMEH